MPDLSREKIREIFSKEARRLDKLYDRELINGLLYMSQLEILYIINEDKYMKDIFYGIDLDDIESLYENFDDLSSKDCRFVYLTYLWMVVQSSGADLKTFEFMEPKIKFSNDGKFWYILLKWSLKEVIHNDHYRCKRSGNAKTERFLSEVFLV